MCLRTTDNFPGFGGAAFGLMFGVSLVFFFWQVQPTTTAFGAAFGSVPHLFTAWTCYLVLSKTKQD